MRLRKVTFWLFRDCAYMFSGAENRLSRAKISLEDAQKTYDRNAELYSKE